jgi:cytochrome c-type biogenesis protein CcmH
MGVLLLTAVFGVVTLVAIGFVVLPLLRAGGAAGKSKTWLALGAGLGTAFIGLSAYAILGQPGIALVSLSTPDPTNYPALVATLAERMPSRPNDLQGWSLLGRGYVALRNPDQGAKAFAHAIAIAKEQDGAASADLLVDYGEALTDAAGGVSDDAEAAFKDALMQEPGHLVARYYLGLARAERSDKDGALKYWEDLLKDAPPNVPWRDQLIDQVAALKAQTGGGAPNPAAMVARLESELEANPDNLDGWVRLIRAEAVLNGKDKAVATLAKARGIFKNQPQAQAALDKAAQDSQLD